MNKKTKEKYEEALNNLVLVQEIPYHVAIPLYNVLSFVLNNKRKLRGEHPEVEEIFRCEHCEEVLEEVASGMKGQIEGLHKHINSHFTN